MSRHSCNPFVLRSPVRGVSKDMPLARSSRRGHAAPQTERSNVESGFTLIEVLVGLAVFSIAALALLSATRESVRHAVALDARLGADIVADNRLVEVLSAPQPATAGQRTGTVDLGGRRYDWAERVRPLEGFGVMQIEVSVREAGSEQVIASATGLREVSR